MLRLRTFGGLSIDRDEGDRDGGAGGQRRPLAVLAILAAAGEHGVPRTKLIQHLWPDSDDEKARRVLAQTVYALRRDLGRDDLVLGTTELRLNPEAITSDLAEFEHALGRRESERAVALYRGPFLDGFYVPDAPEFERWVEAQRSHLAERYRKALRSLAADARDRGDPRAEAGWCRRLASADPLDAGVALELMHALVASGDRAGALQHARVYETLVRQELDAAPDASITAYATKLRDSPEQAITIAPPKRRTPAALRRTSVPQVARPPVSPKRLSRIVLACIAIAATGAIGAHVVTEYRASRPPALVATRVLVAPFENNTGDTTFNPVGLMAADWVTQRLAETGLVDVVDARTAMLAARQPVGSGPPAVRALAQQTGAGTIVWGSFYRDGDSLRFQSLISDARAGRLLRSVDPVSGPVRAPLVAVDRLREHVTGALAVLYNPRLSESIQRATFPPTYEAYQEFEQGLDAQVRGQKREAISHYLRSATLDSTYAQPVLWSIDAYLTTHEYASADSLITRLAARRGELAPFDRFFLDNSIAQIHGDWASAVRTSHQMVDAAPGGEGLLDVGYFELMLDHPHHALTALKDVDANRGWMKGWDGYWMLPAAAYHMLGDHRSELAIAKEGRDRFPSAWRTMAAEVRALAALGRSSDLTARLDETLPWIPSDTMNSGRLMIIAADELRAHGHSDSTLYSRAVRWFRISGPNDRAGLAEALDASGHSMAADTIWTAIWTATGDIDALGSLGVGAARRGDKATAAQYSVQLAAIARPYLFGRNTYQRARIAAQLGDKDGAVELLRVAFTQGKPYDLTLHTDRALEPLHGYDPFDHLLEPAD
ncbi:MAG TPA: BTAD domain-containing putative transcriptional regulator [Gemmatimonadaceae bacterium]|nr:BTAD domain-containing putative transcriptional regulator [Gemmatimonadaceae bacterium]